MAYLTKRFQKIVRKHGGFRKGGNPSRVATVSDLCHKCGKVGHFIRDCLMLKAETKEYKRPVGEKDKRRDLVPEKNARKFVANYVVKKALAVWGDSSSESGELECPDDVSILVVQVDAKIFDGLLALMAKSDDEDDEEKLTAEKDSMNNSLDSLSEEKTVMTVHMSVIEEQVTVLEAENLELKEQLSIMNEKSGKRKGEATNLQIELEANLNTAETRLALALERNDQMERDLVRLREELKNSLKWTSSTKLLSNITSQRNYNGKVLGIAWKASQEKFSVYSRQKIAQKRGPAPTPKSSNRKRTNLPHWARNILIMLLSAYWELTLKWVPKSNKLSLLQGSKGSSSQCRFMESGCSKHMPRNTENFLSLKALQGGGVSFADGKKGYILGVGWTGKSLEDSIENGYYVSGLKYNVLSVSQICNRGNEVKFLSDKCIVTSLSTKKVILTARRRKNMYVVDLKMTHGDDLTYLSAQSENANLWHRRLGHVSSSLLNKLVSRDLVRGLPKLKFSDKKVCDACVKGKQIRSSFKQKKQVSSSRVLELIHMDLCGPVKIQSRGGKKYILLIVDDYSRFTRTMFLKSKCETTEGSGPTMELSWKMRSLTSSVYNGIHHNFSAPRTLQQNGVVERKNRTLIDIARTMLIESNLPQNFWAEVVNIACYVTNMCLIRSLLKKTPYELLNNKKPKLNYLRAFGCKCFVLNNCKDDLGKFDPRSDKVFVGYSSFIKAYRVFNKRTLCIEESVHSNEVNGPEVEGSQESDGAGPGPSGKINEADKSTKGPGPSNNADQEESPHPENDDSEVEEEQTDQPQLLSSKSRWKPKSSHPLENLISP
ncbi:hypothetical protein KY290_023330 [Solanum tuberosum]|uniref:Uncharacterized protein n=1 Tax=Solanum tuberosum TaxID=4113 RepID=A0ABQ7V6Z5_SOLTU|nr:hypothetical protein KY289_020260 [Solanum tuberosum]KAH0692921.1 hypothetical protein KY285_020018 [Solanum tuberosum]KAH0759837.1 hypothetical protein KY290_023330 [Solanum tuberosum]